MKDHIELKRLAEAATPGEWNTDDPWVVYAQVDGDIIYLASTNNLDTRGDQRFKDAAFIAAANPAAVLALISDLDRTTAELKRMTESRKVVVRMKLDAQQERDQLKAENEALRKNAERYEWLRDKSESIHQFYLSTPIWFTGVKFNKESVDSTIDAAMAKEKASD